jgi:hypothetical protein
MKRSIGRGQCKRYQDLHVSKLLRDDQAIITNKGLAGSLDSLLTICSERNVRHAGVSPVEGPLCLAMADDKDSRCCQSHDFLAQ